jgi:hypothetical protein
MKWLRDYLLDEIQETGGGIKTHRMTKGGGGECQSTQSDKFRSGQQVEVPGPWNGNV